MGESKRRKQNLGDNYGQTPPMLKDGSKQLDEHLEKFAEALSIKMEELGQGLNLPNLDNMDGFEAMEAMEGQLSPEEARQKSEEMSDWIGNYLEPYRPQDREKLAIGLLNPIYDDIFDLAEESSHSDTEESLDLFMINVMHGLSTFSMLKPFLSERSKEMYAEPMKSLYSLLIADMEEDNEEAKDSLKVLFEPCLEG